MDVERLSRDWVARFLERVDGLGRARPQGLRVAKPDGLVAFQLWTRLPARNRLQPRRRAYAALRALRMPRPLLTRLGLSPRGRGLAVPESQIRGTIESRGGTLLATEPDGGWGLWYFVVPAPAEASS